jgi:hypothetical protein
LPSGKANKDEKQSQTKREMRRPGAGFLSEREQTALLNSDVTKILNLPVVYVRVE